MRALMLARASDPESCFVRTHASEKMTPLISRGFQGRRPTDATGSRLPPGQYETRDFPVLSAGPTPRTPLSRWDFTLRGLGGKIARWSWDEFNKLPRTSLTTDIHCVTKWSRLGTSWEGVAIDTLLAESANLGIDPAPYTLAVCDGGYTTNVPLADLTSGKGMIALTHDGAPLPAEHGGPARLLVPHLYFWKSAKWVRELRFMGAISQASGIARLSHVRRPLAGAALHQGS
jgi:DMSO/TMAO reductase YedYZ molybdopterin-dependent catalytic subunit